MKNFSPLKKAAFFVLFAAFFGEIANAFIRPASGAFNPLTLACIRVFVAVIVAIVLFHKEIRLSQFRSLPLKAWGLVFLIGAVFWAPAIYFLTSAITQAQLANVSFIVSQQPMIVFVLSLFFLGSQFDLKKFLLVILSIYGVMVLGTGSFTPQLQLFGIGEAFALISAIAAAAGFIGRKALTGYLNAVETSVSTMLIASLTLFIISLFTSEPLTIQSITPMALGSLLGGGATMALTSVFNNKAIDLANPIFVSQMGLSKVLFASLLGLSLFGELLEPIALVGGLILVGSVYFSTKARGVKISKE